MWNARYGDYYYDSRNQFLPRQGHRRYSSYSHGYNMNNYDQQAMPNDYYHFQNPPMNQTGQYRSQRQHRYDSNLNNKYCDSYSMHYNQAISYANDNALHAKRYTTPKSDYINFTSNDRTPSNKSNCKTPSNISDNVSCNNISNNVTHKPTQNNENCSNVVDKSLVIHNNNKIQFSNKCDSNQTPKSSAINDLNHTNKIPVSSEGNVSIEKIYNTSNNISHLSENSYLISIKTDESIIKNTLEKTSSESLNFELNNKTPNTMYQQTSKCDIRNKYTPHHNKNLQNLKSTPNSSNLDTSSAINISVIKDNDNNGNKCANVNSLHGDHNKEANTKEMYKLTNKQDTFIKEICKDHGYMNKTVETDKISSKNDSSKSSDPKMLSSDVETSIESQVNDAFYKFINNNVHGGDHYINISNFVSDSHEEIYSPPSDINDLETELFEYNYCTPRFQERAELFNLNDSKSSNFFEKEMNFTNKFYNDNVLGIEKLKTASHTEKNGGSIKTAGQPKLEKTPTTSRETSRINQQNTISSGNDKRSDQLYLTPRREKGMNDSISDQKTPPIPTEYKKHAYRISIFNNNSPSSGKRKEASDYFDLNPNPEHECKRRKLDGSTSTSEIASDITTLSVNENQSAEKTPLKSSKFHSIDVNYQSTERFTKVIASTPHKTNNEIAKKCKLSTPHKDAEQIAKGTPYTNIEKIAKGTPHKNAEKIVRGTPHKDIEKTAKGTPHKNAEKNAKGTPHKNAEKIAKGTPYKNAEKIDKGTPHKDVEKNTRGTPHRVADNNNSFEMDISNNEKVKHNINNKKSDKNYIKLSSSMSVSTKSNEKSSDEAQENMDNKCRKNDINCNNIYSNKKINNRICDKSKSPNNNTINKIHEKSNKIKKNVVSCNKTNLKVNNIKMDDDIKSNIKHIKSPNNTIIRTKNIDKTKLIQTNDKINEEKLNKSRNDKRTSNNNSKLEKVNVVLKNSKDKDKNSKIDKLNNTIKNKDTSIKDKSSSNLLSGDSEINGNDHTSNMENHQNTSNFSNKKIVSKDKGDKTEKTTSTHNKTKDNKQKNKSKIKLNENKTTTDFTDENKTNYNDKSTVDIVKSKSNIKSEDHKLKAIGDSWGSNDEGNITLLANEQQLSSKHKSPGMPESSKESFEYNNLEMDDDVIIIEEDTQDEDILEIQTVNVTSQQMMTKHFKDKTINKTSINNNSTVIRSNLKTVEDEGNSKSEENELATNVNTVDYNIAKDDVIIIEEDILEIQPPNIVPEQTIDEHQHKEVDVSLPTIEYSPECSLYLFAKDINLISVHDSFQLSRLFQEFLPTLNKYSGTIAEITSSQKLLTSIYDDLIFTGFIIDLRNLFEDEYTYQYNIFSSRDSITRDVEYEILLSDYKIAYKAREMRIFNSIFQLAIKLRSGLDRLLNSSSFLNLVYRKLCSSWHATKPCPSKTQVMDLISSFNCKLQNCINCWNISGNGSGATLSFLPTGSNTNNNIIKTQEYDETIIVTSDNDSPNNRFNDQVINENLEKLPISEICLEPCEIDIKSEIIELSDDEDTKTTLNYPVGIRIGIASNRISSNISSDIRMSVDSGFSDEVTQWVKSTRRFMLQHDPVILCALCDKAAEIRCAYCKFTCYCSKVCQTNHWYSEHNENCLKK